MEPSALWYLSCIGHPGFSSDRAFMPTGPNSIPHGLYHLKDPGSNLQLTLTMSCTPISIERRNYRLQHFLRAIGFESDKDILEIFGLADEIKVSKTGLKKIVGRKLAARVLKSWIEDFVDEDTGEVVSIERNEVIIDRETVLENEHIDQIVDSGSKTILLHKDDANI
jgi:DNA-directed RNA polymerase beta subunit